MFTWTDGDFFVLIKVIETNHTTLDDEKCQQSTIVRTEEDAYGIFDFTAHVLIFAIAFLSKRISSKAEKETICSNSVQQAQLVHSPP
jgi:hypothetical protein